MNIRRHFRQFRMFINGYQTPFNESGEIAIPNKSHTFGHRGAEAIDFLSKTSFHFLKRRSGTHPTASLEQ